MTVISLSGAVHTFMLPKTPMFKSEAMCEFQKEAVGPAFAYAVLSKPERLAAIVGSPDSIKSIVIACTRAEGLTKGT
ncbi:MAG: hypothetical protein D6698_11640 [Gammaproteobacteria bacterium]|nr:MAG: hypothetical protein D6698_11640 [Gammaproteobacteria bacterium]